MVALNKYVKSKCVVTHPAGASAEGIYSLRGRLADILYSWSNNAFRLFESFRRK